LYYNTIDNRANFFGAMDRYEQNEDSGTKWFAGAEAVSGAPLTGLGADGHGSWATFLGGSLLAGVNAPSVYDWRSEAGNALMNSGFDSFRDLYNNGTSNPVAWDIGQLKSEQQTLQPIHEKYLGNESVFTWVSSVMTNSNGIPFKAFEAMGAMKESQTQPGGVNILDYKSRVSYGCRLLGYSAAQG
jgi:filamentous hemagglutinin